MKLHRQLLKNMASGSLATAVNIGVMLVTYPLFLGWLGMETFGLWLLLSSLLALSKITDLGVGLAVAKLVAEYRGAANGREIRALLGLALAVVTATASLPIAFLFAFPEPLLALSGVTAEQKALLIPLLPSLALLILGGLYGDLLLAAVAGMGRTDLSNFFQSLGKVTMAGAAVLLLAEGWHLNAMIYATGAMQLVWVLTSLLFLVSYRVAPAFHLMSREGMTRLFRFSRQIFGGNLMGLCLYPFSTWMLARFAGTASLPIYDIAYRGSMQVRALIEVALRALMTEMSTRQGRGDAIHEAWPAVRRVTIGVTAIALPSFGVIYLSVPYALEWWLGEGFVGEMVPVFRTALLASLISLFGVPGYYLAMGMGYLSVCLRERILNAGGSMVALIVMQLVAGPIGAQSAADAMLFSFTLSLCYLTLSLRRVVTPPLQSRNSSPR